MLHSYYSSGGAHVATKKVAPIFSAAPLISALLFLVENWVDHIKAQILKPDSHISIGCPRCNFRRIVKASAR